ncbi:alpha-glucuronidase [Streptomyces beihaiensis]|uniref:Alpha-glucuronidase n=1 Tax=Streptomyces beihaiensis TaxID=2984495 RepID=A0ABT3U414_9ACTN|nr:alpha-glucuronidase [Streptomyces beihaiensis]MCX3062938.1 alpha-glucuronidase [Streptomyces beihaiensis]
MSVTPADPGLAPDIDPAWLPDEALRAVGSRRVRVDGEGPLADTVRAEAAYACERFGGRIVGPGDRPDLLLRLADDSLGGEGGEGGEGGGSGGNGEDCPRHPEGFTLHRTLDRTTVTASAAAPAGLLHGYFHVVRLGEAAFTPAPAATHRPALTPRMLDHWDNVDVHPVMGQVERGYAGGSLFWRDGRPRDEPHRIRAYARLLASCGIDALAVNNVNVHATEARLLTDRLDDVAAIADLLRPYGIRTHLSVSCAAPVLLGGQATADPLDPHVRAWWRETADRVYARIPDFGGFVVKADSEGQPGPFAYGRSHADGANLLADALAPHGGIVHWRAFVYDHRQDWRDRTTDRARAAHDHFAPLDGEFRPNAILQVKHGPIDFQTREPVSPVIGAMPRTRIAVELQATQEYTGQQWHVCALAPMWSQVLRFRPHGEDGPGVAGVAAGDGGGRGGGGGLVAVSNAGADPFWTGHPLAQFNLYAFGRLAWQPDADPASLLDEWIELTFTPNRTADPDRLRAGLRHVVGGSWETYEKYTAPLGVGFMVQPGHHYGPSVDGYEYSPWGTYHFADRDGVGVDRSRATGTGYAAQYGKPWSDTYETPDTCPDELLLFFHHVPYGHVLRSGKTVIQHIYDTHFEGVTEAEAARALWASLKDLVSPARHARVTERYEEQVRCAREWRDQVNSYFLRKSGVPDRHGRRIH